MRQSNIQMRAHVQTAKMKEGYTKGQPFCSEICSLQGSVRRDPPYFAPSYITSLLSYCLPTVLHQFFLTNLKNCIQDLNVKFCFSTCSIRGSRKCTHYVRVGPVRALIHGIHVNHLLLLLDSDRFASLACSYIQSVTPTQKQLQSVIARCAATVNTPSVGISGTILCSAYRNVASQQSSTTELYRCCVQLKPSTFPNGRNGCHECCL